LRVLAARYAAVRISPCSDNIIFEHLILFDPCALAVRQKAL
jgi:hypothetical protein